MCIGAFSDNQRPKRARASDGSTGSESIESSTGQVGSETRHSHKPRRSKDPTRSYDVKQMFREQMKDKESISSTRVAHAKPSSGKKSNNIAESDEQTCAREPVQRCTICSRTDGTDDGLIASTWQYAEYKATLCERCYRHRKVFGISWPDRLPKSVADWTPALLCRETTPPPLYPDPRAGESWNLLSPKSRRQRVSETTGGTVPQSKSFLDTEYKGIVFMQDTVTFPIM
jgi:hypothetical protein